MQILLAVIYGAAVGALAHYTVSGRDTRGSGVIPMLGAVVGGALWMLLTWLGWGLDSVWLWLLAVVVPAVVVYGVTVTLTRVRRARDARDRVRLGVA